MKRKLSFGFIMALASVATVAVCLCDACKRPASSDGSAAKDDAWLNDTVSLKVAVLPTADNLAAMVAVERGIARKLGVDVRLVVYRSMMDQDTAVQRGRVDGLFSDSVRVRHLSDGGLQLDVVRHSDAYWWLIGNKLSRVSRIEQLGDKIVAQTSYSATDWLTSQVLRGVKTKADVYRVPINDVDVRYNMLLANNVDALWLPQPYASAAIRLGHKKMADSRDINKGLGVLAFTKKSMSDKKKKQQIDLFLKSLDVASDSIKRHGQAHYDDVCKKYYTINTPKK